jgi:hypothetical protein
MNAWSSATSAKVRIEFSQPNSSLLNPDPHSFTYTRRDLGRHSDFRAHVYPLILIINGMRIVKIKFYNGA